MSIIILSAVAFADDLILLAETIEDMEVQLRVLGVHGGEFEMKFSAGKSKMLVVGGEEQDQEHIWILGGNIIEQVEEFTYLGVKIGSTGVNRHREHVKNKAKKLAGLTYTASMRKRNKYEVIRELWKGVAVPACMYGAEIINYRKSDMEDLERTQNKVARLALGAPKYTAVEGLRGELGYSTWEERIAKAHILFARKLEVMDDDRWARKLLLHRAANSQWKRETEKLERKWNTVGMGWLDAKKQVEEQGVIKWKEGMQEKSTLRWLRNKEKPRKEWCYTGSWSSRLLMRARLGILETNDRKWDDNADRSCRGCGVVESMEHVIIECDDHEEARERADLRYGAILGVERWEEFKQEEAMGMDWILGFKGDGETRMELMDSTKTFLSEIWDLRQRTAADA